MPRLATFIAVLTLALPGTALAQGAGDDQYRDPFPQEAEQAQGSGEQGGLSEEPNIPGGTDSGSPSGSGSGGDTTGGSPNPGPAAVLPNTGSDPRILLLTGLALVLVGVGLRLRTIDPDAY